MKNNKLFNLNISGNRLKNGLVATCMLAVAACSKMDDYKERFVPEGEKTYTGKIDSVKVFAGNNRVKFKGLLSPDPRIVSYKVYWGGRQDSATFEIHGNTGGGTLEQIIPNVTESEQTFEFVTFDALGNKSVSTYANGTSYGTRYVASLLNRAIESSSLTPDLETEFNFVDIDSATGAFATEVRFLKATGDSAVYLIPRTSSDTVLLGHKYGSEVVYRTYYKPTLTAIDTFYTAYAKFQPVSGAAWINLTPTLVKNAGGPFKTATYDGSRWGTLADWTTSADVKNVNATYGGFEMRGGVGVLSMEGGWGLPAVPNGKIYQVVHLPYAGKWKFTLNLSALGTTGTKYMVVNKATTVPDFANVTTASYYLNFSTMSATSAPTIEFNVDEESDVTIGIVATMPNTGTYFKVASVSLSYFKQ